MPDTPTISIDGKETLIKSFEYQLLRGTDEYRRPNTETQIPKIKIIQDSNENHRAILKWLSEPDTPKDVTITIYEDAKKSKKKSEIKLTNAFVVEYNERVELNGTNLTEEFQLTAEKIDIDGNKFDVYWPGKK